MKSVDFSIFPGALPNNLLNFFDSPLLGICWRFGFDELNLPVAALYWFKVVWILPVLGSIFLGRATKSKIGNRIICRNKYKLK